MYLKILNSGDVSLRDIDNFKAFSILSEITETNWPASVKNMMSMADENRFWLEADAVLSLSAKKDDEAWVRQFWKMLKAAEPYGFSDVKARRIKAHVEYAKE